MIHLDLRISSDRLDWEIEASTDGATFRPIYYLTIDPFDRGAAEASLKAMLTALEYAGIPARATAFGREFK